MRGTLWLTALFFVLTMSAQTGAPVIWEPPLWDFPQNIDASAPKQLATNLHIGAFRIDLEKTTIDEVEHRLGGQIGRKGDAGDSLEWLCLYGQGTVHRWVLWLESAEIDGGTVGSFQWQQLAGNQSVDQRCKQLDERVVLPLPLKLGDSEARVRGILDKPAWSDGQRMIYLHEHQGKLHGIPYDFSNMVLIRTVNGRVVYIAVSKTTSS